MTKRDFETLYYEQQAEYTEERGMLAQERDMWRDRAEAAERELAEACLSIAKGTPWIPVSERLPNACEYVIAVRGGTVGHGFLDTEGRWRWDDMGGSVMWREAPTHWMPLPEAPK